MMTPLFFGSCSSLTFIVFLFSGVILLLAVAATAEKDNTAAASHPRQSNQQQLRATRRELLDDKLPKCKQQKPCSANEGSNSLKMYNVFKKDVDDKKG